MNRLLHKIAYLPLILGTILAGIALVGCSDGSDGTSSGTVTGTVTNGASSGAPLAGATVTPSPNPGGATYTTDAAGSYTASLGIGSYTLTFSADGFEDYETSVVVVAASTTTVDVELEATSPVRVSISGAPSSTSPGAAFDLTAQVTALDGSTVQSYSWTQTNSAAATIENATSATAGITLGDVEEYKAALLEELDPPSRWQVLGIDPFALEEGGAVTFECEVTTSSGSYTGEVAVHTTLGFAATGTGLRNVPLGLPVLLGSRAQASYSWVLTPPGGSSASLEDATTANPWFVPDVAGLYSVTVFDLEADSDTTIEVYAAEWVGGIDGQDENGRPTMSCISCHDGIFPDIFEEWAETGHAEIFTDNINEGGHYSTGCLDCHAVGYHEGVDNGGMDDTVGYDEFLAAMFPGGTSHPDADNWDTILAEFPDQARMANVQCEQCHGPNGVGGAHIQGHEMDGARVSTDAQVCASCHGEPPRHARFQQWKESGHGNFETALGEGTIASCAKCHTAQGFLEWFANDLDTAYSTHAVEESLIQPITCVVCHDPHNVGTTSGDANDVPLRVDGDSPPLLGGFTAYDIGHGAMCIVCHNTRRGAANDETGLPSLTAYDTTPHVGAQGDVFMGQNCFFVTVGLRSGHSYIENTCTQCHMQITPPPADLSYQLSGTNHTFAAGTAICSDCHGNFSADSLVSANDAALLQYEEAIAEAIAAEIEFHTGAPNNDTVRLSGTSGGSPADIDVDADTVIGAIVITESHGRAAMNIELDGALLEGVRLASDTELLGAGGNLLDNAVASNNGVILAKCVWNFFMLENDASHGIHNPGFYTNVIVNSTNVIQATWP